MEKSGEPRLYKHLVDNRGAVNIQAEQTGLADFSRFTLATVHNVLTVKLIRYIKEYR